MSTLQGSPTPGGRGQRPSNTNKVVSYPEMSQVGKTPIVRPAVVGQKPPSPPATPPDAPLQWAPSSNEATPTATPGSETSVDRQKNAVPPRPAVRRNATSDVRTPQDRQGSRSASLSASKSPKEVTPNTVDEKVENVLLRSSQKDGYNGDEGHNYVLRVVVQGHAGTFIKIGTTKNAVEVRQANIKAKCKHERVDTLSAHQRPLREYRRAEKLIKAELHGSLHLIQCGCGTKHTEYFNVDAAIALETTRRWTSFCETDPWDEKHTLHMYWRNRLKNRKQCHDSETLSDHKPRAERWEHFVNSTTWDIVKFNAASLKHALLPRRWQWTAFFQALYLSYATFPDPMSVVWLVALVAWMLVERDLHGATFQWDRVRSFDQPLSSAPDLPSKEAEREEWDVMMKGSNNAAESLGDDEDEDMEDVVEVDVDVLDNTPSRKPR